MPDIRKHFGPGLGWAASWGVVGKVHSFRQAPFFMTCRRLPTFSVRLWGVMSFGSLSDDIANPRLQELRASIRDAGCEELRSTDAIA